MRISRQLTIAAMLALLVIPGGVQAGDAPAPADDLILGDDDWRSSEDGALFVFRRPDGAPFGEAGLDIDPIGPGELGPPLDQLDAEADLYEVISGAELAGYGLVRLRDRDALSFGEEGQTPVILEVRFDELGGSFLQDQRIIDLPPACDNGAPDGDGCLPAVALRDLAAELIADTAAVPRGMSPPVQLFDPLDLVNTGASDGSGTHTGLGGGISVETTLEPAAGDSYEVRATATISELFGGQAISAATREVRLDEDSDLVRGAGGPVLLDMVTSNGTTRFEGRLDCHAGETGVAITDVLIEGAGADLPGNLGPGFEGLAGGTDVTVTTVIPFICPGSNGAAGPVAGPGQTVLSLACFGYDVLHGEYQTRIGGRKVLFPSRVRGKGVVLVLGTPEQALRYSIRSDLNRGRRLRGPLDEAGQPELELDPRFDSWQSAGDPPLTDAGGAVANGDADEALLRWLTFEFDAGIETLGPKQLRRLTIEGESGRADLTEQAHEAIGGKSFGVKRRETSGGNCPDDLSDLDVSDLDIYLPVVLR